MDKNIELSLTQDEFETVLYWYQWMKENNNNENKDNNLFEKINNKIKNLKHNKSVYTLDVETALNRNIEMHELK